MRRVFVLIGTMGASFIAAMALATVMVQLSSLDSMTSRSIIVGFAGCFVTLFSGTIYYWFHTNKQRMRDYRAFHEIVDMLRELLPAMENKKRVSNLERAAFRIRLSRLDIGPGQYPAESNISDPGNEAFAVRRLMAAIVAKIAGRQIEESYISVDGLAYVLAFSGERAKNMQDVMKEVHSYVQAKADDRIDEKAAKARVLEAFERFLAKWSM